MLTPISERGERQTWERLHAPQSTIKLILSILRILSSAYFGQDKQDFLDKNKFLVAFKPQTMAQWCLLSLLVAGVCDPGSLTIEERLPRHRPHRGQLHKKVSTIELWLAHFAAHLVGVDATSTGLRIEAWISHVEWERDFGYRSEAEQTAAIETANRKILLSDADA